MNGFFVRVMFQPFALKETGVPPADVALFVAASGSAFIALDVALGAWFIRRFATARRSWTLALALLLAAAAERVYGAGLVYLGGPAMFAASGVLPLQVPVRMNTLHSRLFGKRAVDQFAGQESLRLPAGIAPEEIRFTRRPDVLFVIAESLPATHLAPDVMPNLWRRAGSGARFTRHYAGAVATPLHALQPALRAPGAEARGDARRRAGGPVLFPALRENGYAVKVLSASCLDWMDLRETVFAGRVRDDLKNRCDGKRMGYDRDPPAPPRRAHDGVAGPARSAALHVRVLLRHALQLLPPAEDVAFTPEWDGCGGLKASTAPAGAIENRARNAAHALDRHLESFLPGSSGGAAARRSSSSPATTARSSARRDTSATARRSPASRSTCRRFWFGPGVPVGTFPAPTSHADVLPTLLALLGDRHPPALYSDGMSAFEAPSDRFVVSTVGWEPSYAVIGLDVKVRMYAGLGTASVTDLDDKPLADGDARLAKHASGILRAMRGEPEPAAARPGPPPAVPPTAPPATKASRP